MVEWKKRRHLEAAEGDQAHDRARNVPILRSGSSASGGHSPTSAGHQANSSCSSSGTTVAPSGNHAWPTISTTSLGSLTSASTRSRRAHRPLLAQLARHRVDGVLVDLDRAARAERPAPCPRRQPRRRAAPPASARRRRGPRTAPTGSARRCRPAAAAPSGAGWSSSVSRSARASNEASLAANPSWLGDPRSRSALSATSAASVSLCSGSYGSGRHEASTWVGSQGPRASRPGAVATRQTVAGRMSAVPAYGGVMYFLSAAIARAYAAPAGVLYSSKALS